MPTQPYCKHHDTPTWDQLEEYEHIAELLTYVLDLGEATRAAQLFGVSLKQTSFHLTALRLDPNDPMHDLWGLARDETTNPMPCEHQHCWTWVIVTCESESDSYLAVAVSRSGETAIEIRTPGGRDLRSRHQATGPLIDVCRQLFDPRDRDQQR